MRFAVDAQRKSGWLIDGAGDPECSRARSIHHRVRYHGETIPQAEITAAYDGDKEALTDEVIEPLCARRR